ncbi:MAG: glycosyl hydrolase, partial [Caldilineae bacterium]
MAPQPSLSNWNALKFRCIGPPRGGRVVAACGHPTDRNVFYFGGVAGGVWKTVDGGVYWENISDGYLSSSSVGAIAVSEADPNVIYVGMGETSIRGDVSWGDGVYKSTDGGKTWRNVGLKETHHIGQIRIHPKNPDVVYVAALGHAFGPNEERGVFRTTDGGQTWEKVLYVSERAGAVDLALDVTNPRNLYATIWQVHRHFWELISGGPDSGLWKSTDGGDTWTDITRNKGLPQEGILGKMGVAVSPARPDRVWAIIEAEGDKAGVYRSDDGGATWKHLTPNRDLLARPWYYMHIFADPQDPDTVYVNNLRMWKSTDGGVNWSEITTPHGDNHALWIDPQDPQRMINGNDGGACVSFNGGETWSSIYNQMTGQFYHLDVDNQIPYRVYGTQQDNSSISVPSASEKGAIPWTDCYPAGTGESGYIAVKPDDPNIVYVGAVGSSPGGGGALQRYDHRTKQIRLVTVWPELYSGWGAKDMVYRF